jgi:hypothetical protein
MYRIRGRQDSEGERGSPGAGLGKKDVKMKIAPDELLKTKGQESGPEGY